MPIRRLPSSFNLSLCYFYDDFSGSLYDDRFWAVTGTGSVATIDGVGGIIQVRSNSNSSYFLGHNSFCAFSAAKNAVFETRFRVTNTASVYAEIGLSGTHYACILSNSGAWNTYTSSAGGNTSNASGISLDTSWHNIVISTNDTTVTFRLDGTIIGTHTTNLPTSDLQPYVYISNTAGATRDIELDYITVYGDRD